MAALFVPTVPPALSMAVEERIFAVCGEPTADGHAVMCVRVSVPQRASAWVSSEWVLRSLGLGRGSDGVCACVCARARAHARVCVCVYVWCVRVARRAFFGS